MKSQTVVVQMLAMRITKKSKRKARRRSPPADTRRERQCASLPAVTRGWWGYAKRLESPALGA
eukprot:9240256-Pyramimonas_sp.AAC.2